MVHIIFLLKTSHVMDRHKIWSKETGDMIFARLQEIWILNKREEGAVESLTAGPACQVRLPHDRDDVHQRFLRDGEVFGQTKGTNVIPRHLRTG